MLDDALFEDEVVLLEAALFEDEVVLLEAVFFEDEAALLEEDDLTELSDLLLSAIISEDFLLSELPP